MGADIRQARRRRGLTLRQLGAPFGLDERRLSDFELGLRSLPLEVVVTLSEFLGLPELTEAEFPCGRRLRTVEKPFLRRHQVPRREYDPPCDRPPSVRRNAAHAIVPQLVERLEARHAERDDHARVEAFLQAVSCRSWLEYLVPAWELALDATPLRVSPHELGYSHYALVDPLTYEAVGDRLWPALGFSRDGVDAVAFFQAGMRPRYSLWILDILLYLRARGGRPRWGMIEVDGDGHRSERDEEKELQVGLTTVRLDEYDVVGGRFWDAVLEELLPPPMPGCALVPPRAGELPDSPGETPGK